MNSILRRLLKKRAEQNLPYQQTMRDRANEEIADNEAIRRQERKDKRALAIGFESMDDRRKRKRIDKQINSLLATVQQKVRDRAIPFSELVLLKRVLERDIVPSDDVVKKLNKVLSNTPFDLMRDTPQNIIKARNLAENISDLTFTKDRSNPTSKVADIIKKLRLQGRELDDLSDDELSELVNALGFQGKISKHEMIEKLILPTYRKQPDIMKDRLDNLFRRLGAKGTSTRMKLKSLSPKNIKIVQNVMNLPSEKPQQTREDMIRALEDTGSIRLARNRNILQGLDDLEKRTEAKKKIDGKVKAFERLGFNAFDDDPELEKLKKVRELPWNKKQKKLAKMGLYEQNMTQEEANDKIDREARRLLATSGDRSIRYQIKLLEQKDANDMTDEELKRYLKLKGNELKGTESRKDLVEEAQAEQMFNAQGQEIPDEFSTTTSQDMDMLNDYRKRLDQFLPDSEGEEESPRSEVGSDRGKGVVFGEDGEPRVMTDDERLAQFARQRGSAGAEESKQGDQGDDEDEDEDEEEERSVRRRRMEEWRERIEERDQGQNMNDISMEDLRSRLGNLKGRGKALLKQYRKLVDWFDREIEKRLL